MKDKKQYLPIIKEVSKIKGKRIIEPTIEGKEKITINLGDWEVENAFRCQECGAQLNFTLFETKTTSSDTVMQEQHAYCDNCEIDWRTGLMTLWWSEKGLSFVLYMEKDKS